MQPNERLAALAAGLPEELDGVLLTGEVSRRYYTGFSSSDGTILLWRTGTVFWIDSRYYELAARTVQSCDVVLQQKLFEQLNAVCAQNGLRRLAVDGAYLTVQSLEAMRRRVKAELVFDERVQAAMTAQRRHKSAAELQCIRAAQEITDRSFEHILGFIRPGVTEREIALELEFYSRRLGSEAVSFDIIAVAGENGSLPHGVPGDRPVALGELVTMDFGATVGGYRSDMTRTVAVGKPTPQQRKVYETVLKAQRAALSFLAPGVSCSEVDAAARSVIEAAGYGDFFGHALGHSVGLEIHEEPRFSPASGQFCEPGDVMTVEPGIYLPGVCGCRIEDMVYLTESGFENLTASPKELIEL